VNGTKVYFYVLTSDRNRIQLLSRCLVPLSKLLKRYLPPSRAQVAMTREDLTVSESEQESYLSQRKYVIGHMNKTKNGGKVEKLTPAGFEAGTHGAE